MIQNDTTSVKPVFTPDKRVHRLKWQCGYKSRCSIDLNQVVTLISALLIWGLVIWCAASPQSAREKIIPVGKWITNTFTWYYVLNTNLWLIFVMVLYFKFGHVKLGKRHDKPEFSDASYFAMLYAAGIGVGMFHFGVSEVILHYAPKTKNRISFKMINDNQRAQEALTITFLHWGIHGWVAYLIVGLSVSVVAYRRDLGMTIRSSFYPIIGDRIYGWLGDLIDILSIVTIVLGVNTSLGLSAGQVNAWLNRMNPDIDESKTNTVIIVWVITCITSLSVVSGLKFGIRRLSELCFGIVSFIMVLVLLRDDPWHLFNVYIQSVGSYFQAIVKLGTQTDAFAQQDISRDGLDAPEWMNDWTVFYWGWWVAWAPFVGMFIARISKGRTIREFIIFNLGLTVAYIFLWFSIFGGIGLRMERQADRANITCSSVRGGESATFPGDNKLYKLSCRDPMDQWFDVISAYEQIADFLKVLSFVGVILYFVTSSDSSSLVADCISANGLHDAPVIQRVFWCVTEGACATALLLADKDQGALNTLRAITIAGGLPYTVVLNFMCLALWRFLKSETRDAYGELQEPHTFTKDILDVTSSLRNLPKLGLCCIVPWYFLGRSIAKLNKYDTIHKIATMVVMAILFYSTVLLIILHVLVHDLVFVGIAVYGLFVVYCSGIRTQMRQDFAIEGNIVEDFFAVLFFFPIVSYQMDQHMLDQHKIEPNSISMESVGQN